MTAQLRVLQLKLESPVRQPLTASAAREYAQGRARSLAPTRARRSRS